MSAEDLAANLGTLAKSGTSDFLSEAESDTKSAGNLIGQFGVGFYSASVPLKLFYIVPGTDSFRHLLRRFVQIPCRGPSICLLNSTTLKSESKSDSECLLQVFSIQESTVVTSAH